MGLLGGILGGVTGGLKNAVEAVPKAVVHTVNGATAGAQAGASGAAPASVPGLPNLATLPAAIQSAATTPHASGQGTVLDHMVTPILTTAAGLASSKIPVVGRFVAPMVVGLGLKGIHDAMHALEQPYQAPRSAVQPAAPPAST
jgi:hypothetical protein